MYMRKNLKRERGERLSGCMYVKVHRVKIRDENFQVMPSVSEKLANISKSSPGKFRDEMKLF
jgi:hypothetical protein